MRTLEILLSLVNALALVALLVPLSRRLRWMRSLALLAPLTAGAQMLVEGWRWQMVPSYALAACSARCGSGNGQRRNTRRPDWACAGLVAFLDRHLRGRPAPLLDGPSEAFPEVQIESRQ
jgi:hypothetical protein